VIDLNQFCSDVDILSFKIRMVNQAVNWLVQLSRVATWERGPSQAWHVRVLVKDDTISCLSITPVMITLFLFIFSTTAHPMPLLTPPDFWSNH
jgi:hypothetical protein